MRAIHKFWRGWAREHRKDIVARFTQGIEPVEFPVSVFMAGSPGAGKTEFSKRLIEKFGGDVVRIDADDIRDLMPQYQGGNAYLFQGAVSLGMEKLYDYALDKRLNTVVDGTLKKYEKAKSNIERSLRKNRKVEVFYVYQSPEVAWDFTKKREAVEGRNIPKEAFIESFILARENVLKLKDVFGATVAVHVVLKNITNDGEEIFYDVVDIDLYVKVRYSQDKLERMIAK
jgi:dephospho-CoA kinase